MEVVEFLVNQRISAEEMLMGSLALSLGKVSQFLDKVAQLLEPHRIVEASADINSVRINLA